MHTTYTHGTHGYGHIGGSGPDRPVGLCLASSGLGREVRSDYASTRRNSSEPNQIVDLGQILADHRIQAPELAAAPETVSDQFNQFA